MSAIPDNNKLNLLKQLEEIEAESPEEYGRRINGDIESGKYRVRQNERSELSNEHQRVRQVSARSRTGNWSEIRKCYVLGKKKQLEDGTWVSEDYTFEELARKFMVNRGTLQNKSSSEGWPKLRKAYLARVNQINIGQELGLYTTENYQAEISALNACNKLGIVLDKYIENKFGGILKASEDTSMSDEDIGNLMVAESDYEDEQPAEVVELADLKQAITVANDIYKLQRQIYNNAPQTEIEVIEKLTSKKPLTDIERKQRMAKLQARLADKWKQVEQEE